MKGTSLNYNLSFITNHKYRSEPQLGCLGFGIDQMEVWILKVTKDLGISIQSSQMVQVKKFRARREGPYPEYLLDY